MKYTRSIRYFLGSLLKPLIRLENRIYSRLSFTRDVYTEVGSKRLFFQCYEEEISNSLFYTGIFGDFEGETLRLWLQCIAAIRPKIILDIGAHSGIYTLVAALSQNQSTIYSFEPNKITFKILQRNVALNSFKNIYLCNYGVSTSTSEQIFYNWGNNSNSGMSMINHKKINPDLGTVSLPVKDFLEIRESVNKKIDLIKMDIERAELPILRHAIDAIAQDRPVIFCEVLDKELYPEFNLILKELGYKTLKIDDKNKQYFFVEDMALETKVGMNWIFYPNELKDIFKREILH